MQSKTVQQTVMTLEQPDIEYHPDMANFRARTRRRFAENPNLANVPLPDGFPKKVEGPIVWEGKDWTNEEQWVHNLSEVELEEITNALTHFKSMFSSGNPTNSTNMWLTSEVI
jgi:hypothetical protein